jgi:hypothetical protein
VASRGSPRVRGEHWVISTGLTTDSGSPPRARGARVPVGPTVAGLRGITPACVGSTLVEVRLYATCEQMLFGLAKMRYLASCWCDGRNACGCQLCSTWRGWCARRLGIVLRATDQCDALVVDRFPMVATDLERQALFAADAVDHQRSSIAGELDDSRL